MRFIFILFVWFTLCSAAQSNTDSLRHKISGTIYSHSVHHGGIDFDDSKIPNIPLPNYTLYLIRWKSENEIPLVVTSITTNKNGEFSAKVPPGHYGFVTKEEIDSLVTGQWCPKPTETWNSHTSTNTNWQISTQGPVDVTQGSVSNLVLVYHRNSFCMNCQ